mmetsp:Transcript_52611/g.162701  ORF Transcript_52611/g.162701 Transcript_52611/m.162701 type:complete len:235 (-) Transcript_52611:287-991(-)
MHRGHAVQDLHNLLPGGAPRADGVDLPAPRHQRFPALNDPVQVLIAPHLDPDRALVVVEREVVGLLGNGLVVHLHRLRKPPLFVECVALGLAVLSRLLGSFFTSSSRLRAGCLHRFPGFFVFSASQLLLRKTLRPLLAFQLLEPVLLALQLLKPVLLALQLLALALRSGSALLALQLLVLVLLALRLLGLVLFALQLLQPVLRRDLAHLPPQQLLGLPLPLPGAPAVVDLVRLL